jgi:hypothetical protein
MWSVHSLTKIGVDMSGIIGKRESRGSGIVAGQVPANADIDHDALANFAAGEHYTQANITTLGAVTSGTISTGAVIDDPTMTQGSDATGDVYYRAASGKLTRLATGADGTVLTSTGAGAVPAFEATLPFSLGSWTTKNFGQNYQAATGDEWVTGYMFTTSGLCQGIIFSDSSSTPTTIRTRQAGANGKYQNMSCIIKSGDYWRFSEEDGSGVVLFSLTLN